MGFRGVPGHEFVSSVSEGPRDLLGKRVVGEINFGCGRCENCARGLSRHCPNRSVMGIFNADGAVAEYVAVPAANLHVVPDKVSDVEAVFTEPLAAAFDILEQVQLNLGDQVLVLGETANSAISAPRFCGSVARTSPLSGSTRINWFFLILGSEDYDSILMIEAPIPSSDVFPSAERLSRLGVSKLLT